MAPGTNPSSVSPYARQKGMKVYKPSADNFLAYWVWRFWMWIEATFALGMMERWEKIMVSTVVVSLTLLFLTGLVRFLPHHLLFIARRTAYYFLGQEADPKDVLARLAEDAGKVLERGEL